MNPNAIPHQYSTARGMADALGRKVEAASAELQRFKPYRGANGLLPDHIRESDEYQALKARYDAAFQRYQEYNRAFIRKHGNAHRESLRAERIRKGRA